MNSQGSGAASNEASVVHHRTLSDPEATAGNNNAMYATILVALTALALVVLVGRKRGW